MLMSLHFSLEGGGCPSLPLRIKRSCSCISIGNSCDDKCFLKCVIAGMCDKGKNVGDGVGIMKKS